jgi:hypothetical protein
MKRIDGPSLLVQHKFTTDEEFKTPQSIIFNISLVQFILRQSSLGICYLANQFTLTFI